MQHPHLQKDTPAWIFFVWVSFCTALCLVLLGVLYAPVDLWVKGYLAMGIFFLVGSTFTLAKTIRDNHEVQKLVNRVVDAKTEQILADYELRKA